MACEMRSSGLDDNGKELSEEQQAASNAQRDEMRRRRDVLPPLRSAAAVQLDEAIATNTLPELKSAIEAARAAALEGDGAFDGVGGAGRWMTAEVRDAYLAVHELQKAACERESAARRHELARRERCRTNALGQDKFGRRLWAIEVDTQDGSEAAEAEARHDREAGHDSAGVADETSEIHHLPHGGYMLYVQPATAELGRVIRQDISSAPSQSAAVSEAGGDDADSSDDDVPLSSRMADVIGQVSSPASAAAGANGKNDVRPVMPVTVPLGQGWGRLVGEEAWTNLAASLDTRGQRERALWVELCAAHRALTERRALQARESERKHAAKVADAGTAGQPDEATRGVV